MLYFWIGFAVGMPTGVFFMGLGITLYDIWDETYPKAWYPVDKVPVPTFIKKQAQKKMMMHKGEIYEYKRASRKKARKTVIVPTP